MLKAVAIVAEYNPFHNGHRYQIERARQLTGADVVVAIMSGNWVQRGAPALVDKWHRTEMALAGGADLVLELPMLSAVQSADIFAQDAVAIADQIDCAWLAFGCEHPDWPFRRLATLANTVVGQGVHDYRLPYAQLIQDELRAQTGFTIDQPNDILALNYARGLMRLKSAIQMVPIERIGAGHHDQRAGATFASASTVRKAWLAGDRATVARVVPPTSLAQLDSAPTIDWDALWPMLRYQLVTTPLAQLQQRYQMTEGLEHRLKAAAIEQEGFAGFMAAIKTKRYSWPRLQRLLCYCLLQVDSTVALNRTPYVRPLGFNGAGRRYLSQVKHGVDWPIISKTSQSMLQSVLKVEFNAGMVIQMLTGEHQDLYRHPIVKK